MWCRLASSIMTYIVTSSSHFYGFKYPSNIDEDCASLHVHIAFLVSPRLPHARLRM
jgi:hypothetical protein